MRLAIISHTPHYMKNGQIHGWEPTIREIDYLSKVFTKIFHIAPLHSGKCPNSSIFYSSDKIEFVPLQPSGGNSLIKKIGIFLRIPSNLIIIHNTCKLVDWVHFRAPTNLGLYVLPYLSFFSIKNRWIKYAGNWKQDRPPLSYLFQSKWLENNFQKSFVTINGKWTNQKKHILSFENPCFSNSYLAKIKYISKKKDYFGKLNLCFVGRMVDEKGANLLLSTFLINKNFSWLNKIYFIGDGPQKNNYQKQLNNIKDHKIEFLGSLSKMDLNQYYEKCQIILLPSLSEGFPKVISEAAAHGCVPIVSNVGSIGQYIKRENGILLNHLSIESISEALEKLAGNREILKSLALNGIKASDKFTYENYIQKIQKLILLK